MFAARMPNKAIPRSMSMYRIRSAEVIGPALGASDNMGGSPFHSIRVSTGTGSSHNSGFCGSLSQRCEGRGVSREIHIIGGGLAGCEAAWQVARSGGRAVLHEMRPHRETPAHKTAALAELVCSNSLKSEQENSAPWLLKEELRRLGSLLIGTAARTRVPAGHALTVDRDLFSAEITREIESDSAIEIRRDEVTALDDDRIWIVASGPLTSDALAQEIARITGSERLFFYDSISPIVDADSIDLSIAFRASRYGKSLDGTDDYLNCPFDREQYEAFVDAVLAAQSVPAHIGE